MGRPLTTWWVEFSYSYEYYDEEENKWFKENEFDAQRFTCKKDTIKENVEAWVIEELEFEDYKNLKIKITDFYPTTDSEV